MVIKLSTIVTQEQSTRMVRALLQSIGIKNKKEKQIYKGTIAI